MHELGIAQACVGAALEAAGNEPIELVRLTIGDLHAVEPNSFTFCFKLAAASTPASDARVEISSVPVTVRCCACRTMTAQAGPPYLCWKCGSVDVAVVSGDELIVDAVRLANGRWMIPTAEQESARRRLVARHNHAAV